MPKVVRDIRISSRFRGVLMSDWDYGRPGTPRPAAYGRPASKASSVRAVPGRAGALSRAVLGARPTEPLNATTDYSCNVSSDSSIRRFRRVEVLTPGPCTTGSDATLGNWSRPITPMGCSVVDRMPRHDPASPGIRGTARDAGDRTKWQLPGTRQHCLTAVQGE
jgi:hypothetical protein